MYPLKVRERIEDIRLENWFGEEAKFPQMVMGYFTFGHHNATTFVAHARRLSGVDKATTQERKGFLWRQLDGRLRVWNVTYTTKKNVEYGWWTQYVSEDGHCVYEPTVESDPGAIPVTYIEV